MINSREDIRDFIVSIEDKFPVNLWKVNGICIWPILRIRLYFYLMLEIEGKKKEAPKKTTNNKISFFKKTPYKVKRQIQKIHGVFKEYFLWKQNLPQKEFLFLGANGHRVNHKGKRYNRYFDVLIEQYELKDESLFFEYDSSTICNQYHKDLLFKFNKALIAFKYFFSFKFKKVSFNNEGYNLFLDYLLDNELTKDFAISNSEENICYWAQMQLVPKVQFFKKVLQKIQPKKVLILCYYSDDVMALVAAANKLGIETIEMQHGPQTSIHLAYGSWTTVPEKGYDMLPRTYWCWDSYSKNVLDEWVKASPLYNSRVIGNPWVDYWKNKEENYPNSNYILYTLQPNPLTLDQLFDNKLIDFIKEQPYIWFIRLHPRQLEELNSIRLLLENKGVLHKVNIDNATNDALPQLLANAKIHITHFSGTAIESSFFGKKTILLNPIGLTSFPNLIAANKAVYLNMKDIDFHQKMIEILENDSSVVIDKNLVELKNDNLF